MDQKIYKKKDILILNKLDFFMYFISTYEFSVE